MLFKQKLIDRIAETVDGIATNSSSKKGTVDMSIFIYPKQNRDTPLVEIALIESKKSCRIMVQSPLGIVELAEVDDIRISAPTREVAFISKERGSKMTMVTVSAQGVLQVYSHISGKLKKQDLTKVTSESLRAAIAMKVFFAKNKKKKEK